MILPPGMTAALFSRTVSRLREIVGSEWVFTNDEDVFPYRDSYSPFLHEPGEYVPCGAVAPSNVAEVQQIVRLANSAQLPIWPISTGRNLGYGGASPRLSGTLVLDLKRLNKILEVNDKLAYALVEPGVSYFDLYRHLRAQKHRLWIDCADPGWGSIIGNALEHGVGRTPYRDHLEAHCGMEVVLANGELMRTGMGALPNASTWNTFKYGFGPVVSPIFSQSNFGIVTKMGIHLMPEPEAAQSVTVGVPLREHFGAFIDLMAELVDRRIVDSFWQINSPLLESRDPEVVALLASETPSEQAVEQLGRTKGLAYWATRFWFYGPREIIDAQWNYVQHRFSVIPQATFAVADLFSFPLEDDTRVRDDPVTDSNGDSLRAGGLGIPNMSVFAFAAPDRQHGHIFFSPIITLSGAELIKADEVFREAFKNLDMAWNPPLQICWYRKNIILLFIFPITEDVATNRKLREDLKALTHVAASHGWGEYRSHLSGMDDVASTMSFNNHALPHFLDTIKDAIDPNGILAPGKSGIWPKRYQGHRT